MSLSRVPIAPLLETVVAMAWQGSLLVAVVAVMLRLGPRLSARARHGIWWVALLTVLLGPAVVLRTKAMVVQRALVRSATTSQRDAPTRGSSERTAQTIRARTPGANTRVPQAGETSTALDAITQDSARAARGITVAPANWVLELIGVLWCVAVMTLLTRLGRGFRAMQQLRRESVHMEPELAHRVRAAVSLPPSVSLLVSRHLAVPVALGLGARAIVVPADMTTALDATELEHVVLHELAHLTRRDDWGTLALRLLESVFFFLPPVRIAAQRIQFEQEVACDEWALARTNGDPTTFARSLLRVGELALAALATGSRTPALVSSLDTQLARRIRNLMSQSPVTAHPRHVASWRVVALLVPVAVTVLAGAAAPSIYIAPTRPANDSLRGTLHAASTGAQSNADTSRASQSPEFATNAKAPATPSRGGADSDRVVSRRTIVIPHVPPALPAAQASDSIATLISLLRQGDAPARAQAAFALSAWRSRAIPAMPELLEQLADTTPVARRMGATSVAWWNGEEQQVTSPSEEAVKALLFIGRDARPALEAFVTAHPGGAGGRLQFALRLLGKFD